MPRSAKKTAPKLRLVASDETRPTCGLCGRAKRLTRTECCGNFICDDQDEYVPFSFARNSCGRNHSNQTICAYHHHQAHEGTWKECVLCRKEQEPEMYAWFATNEYNFEKLANPPSYKPTLCAGCGRTIILPEGGYSLAKGKYWCEACDPALSPSSKRSVRGRRRGV